MAKDEHRFSIKEFLDMLSDLLAEKYFQRLDERMKKIPELRRLITTKEASQYLSLSTDTIYRLVFLKKLPYLKIGGRILFDIQALDRWIEKHTIREKVEKIKAEYGKEKSNIKTSKESDLLSLLKKKGSE